MADESIKKGDLVYVAHGRPCCGHETFMGFVFTVENVIPLNSSPFKKYVCGRCKSSVDGLFVLAPKDPDQKYKAFAIKQIKKLNPPTKKQINEVQEKLKTIHKITEKV